MIRVIVSICLLLILVPAVASAQGDKAPDPWARLRFLAGEWSDNQGAVGNAAASGKSSFAFDLNENILVRKNRVETAGKAGEKGKTHEDLLIVYPASAGQFMAIYFDNEGHRINYGVSFPATGTGVTFQSEGSEKSPRFRLAYAIQPDGAASVTFSIAPPGQEFKVYTTGVARKK